MAIPPRLGSELLRAARQRAKRSQQWLADQAGTTRQQIQRLETGERKITRNWAERVAPYVNLNPVDLVFDSNATDIPARAYEIPILGEAAAGRWIEVDAVDEGAEQWLPFFPEPGMSTNGVFALRIRGNSINKLAPDGSLVICRDLATSGSEVLDDMLVVVERLREQEGLRELTVKRVSRKGRKVTLSPESTDPRWKPVTYTEGDVGDDLTLRIIGVVEHIVLSVRRS